MLREVQAEMDRLFGNDQPITYPALRNTNETEWVVKEALRLHPPLFMLLRAVLQDFNAAGYHIPVGTWCIVSPLVAHREEAHFADAARFDPKRYAPGREEDKKPYAYIPFGGGRHVCLGNSFAMLQIKTILAALLRHYDFELFGDPIESDFRGLVIGPKIPCRVRYRRRSNT
jgi:sterol 14-demethylase